MKAPTPAELEARQAAARLLVGARWAKTTRKQRREFMEWMAAQRTPEQKTAGGRPREADRCPCGKFTAERAEARRHNCVSTAVALPATRVDTAQQKKRTKEKTAQ